MNILLVNPNTLKVPPVIPIGLEYLKTALEKNGHNGDILDLCFANSPIKDLSIKISKKSYDVVGFSIRNIDSATYFNNKFFLPEIKELIQCVKKKSDKIPILLGGSGFSAMPHEILEYLQADYGIIGPGEVILPHFLKLLQSNQLTKKIYNGWEHGIDSDLIHKRARIIDYPRYLSDNGIVGFQTNAGCLNACPYCIEAKKRVWFRKIPNIIEEIKYLVDKGYTHFHLCDSGFNLDLKFSIEFCKALIESKNPLKWTLYMKPNPYNEVLFKLLRKSNAYLITLSVDSDERIQTLNNYSYNDLTNIIKYCKKYEIDLAIDLLTGYPYESIDSTKKVIEFFKVNRPQKVGISFYYRIYKNTVLAELIKEDSNLKNNLTRTYTNKERFLEPIFFNQIKQEILEKLISDDVELFHLAGLTPGVNYQLIE